MVSIVPAEKWQKGDIVFRDEFILKDDEERSWYGRAYVPSEYDVQTSPPSREQVSPITIKISTFYTEQLGDKSRTYLLTHEMGHALGLAHPDDPECAIDHQKISSVMSSGPGSNVKDPSFNQPQEYDRIALKGLYNR